MMKRLGDGHSTVFSKEFRDREPRVIGKSQPAPEARDDRDKSDDKEKGEKK